LLEKQYLYTLPTVKLTTLCARPIKRGVQPVYDDSDIRAVKTVNLKNGYLDWSEVQTVNQEFYQAHQRRAGVHKSDVLIASTGTGSLGKVDFYNEDALALADGHVAIVRVNPEQFNPRLLAYLLRSRIGQWQIERQLAGATNQIEIYPEQLAGLRLPKLDHKQQGKLMSRISLIEAEISTARSRLRRPMDIINEILCEAFNYPLSEHKARERERQFTRRLFNFSTSFTLRGSVKIHHSDYDLTNAFFARTLHKRVKAYLAVPIRLGVSLVREAMDDDGEAFYVHPNAIRRESRVDINNCHRIKWDFYDRNRRRTTLRIGDVVIARSGEGTIGKAALFDLDEPCLFSDFTMRLRFNEAINPQFACYFFRSVMFQAQIEREKRGMGNMTNIFPSQVERLLIVDCSRAQQDALADQATAELDALQRERENVEAQRKEIDTLIASALEIQQEI
jgi:restriction endonuclease S subunit